MVVLTGYSGHLLCEVGVVFHLLITVRDVHSGPFARSSFLISQDTADVTLSPNFEICFDFFKLSGS